MGFLSGFIKALDSLPWVRPAIGAVTAVAVLAKSVAHPNTVAYHLADQYLSQVFPLLAGASLGAAAQPKPTPPK